jgi:hypothetical protein
MSTSLSLASVLYTCRFYSQGGHFLPYQWCCLCGPCLTSPFPEAEFLVPHHPCGTTATCTVVARALHPRFPRQNFLCHITLAVAHTPRVQLWPVPYIPVSRGRIHCATPPLRQHTPLVYSCGPCLTSPFPEAEFLVPHHPCGSTPTCTVV